MSQMSGLALSLGMMQIARKIPTDRPDVVLALRVTYVCVVLFQAALFYTAQQRIKAKNDTTVLKYQEPPKAFGGGGEPGAPVTTTVRDYDLKQVNAAFSPLFIGVAIMGFMHLKMGYTQPLLIQSVLPIKGLWDNPILKIHIFGKPATGDLARPFKAGGGLMDALSAATGASNEAAVPTAPIAAGASNSSAKITEITDDDAEEIKKMKEPKKTK